MPTYTGLWEASIADMLASKQAITANRVTLCLFVIFKVYQKNNKEFKRKRYWRAIVDAIATEIQQYKNPELTRVYS